MGQYSQRDLNSAHVVHVNKLKQTVLSRVVDSVLQNPEQPEESQPELDFQTRAETDCWTGGLALQIYRQESTQHQRHQEDKQTSRTQGQTIR